MALTQEMMNSNPQIYDIVLKRITQLDGKEKAALIAKLNNINPNNNSALFKQLPKSIKNAKICFYIFENNEQFIDQQFLKKID